MKNKTTRTVDPAGRISLPGYIRELSGINPGDTVTIEVGDDNVLHIYAKSERCCICGESQEPANMLQVAIGPHEHQICVSCARTIVTTLKK